MLTETATSRIAATPSARPRKVRPGTKKANLLKAFLARGERGLNRFESERLAHDHVLPSSVSGLIRDYGFAFNRQEETVPGFAGSQVSTMRYWLTEQDIILARELLAEGEEE